MYYFLLLVLGIISLVSVSPISGQNFSDLGLNSTSSEQNLTELILNKLGQNFTNLIQDKTRATTLYFSVKPLDNWAYGNARYGESLFGMGVNDAVEMRPNIDKSSVANNGNSSDVYAMIAKDERFNLKNVGLNLYVQQKIKETNLKYLPDLQDSQENETPTKLLSKENVKIINGTTDAVKLIYYNAEKQLKLALFLMIHNKEPYLVFYWANQNLFDKYLSDLEQMMDTIKWIDT